MFGPCSHLDAMYTRVATFAFTTAAVSRRIRLSRRKPRGIVQIQQLNLRDGCVIEAVWFSDAGHYERTVFPQSTRDRLWLGRPVDRCHTVELDDSPSKT